MKTTPKRTSAAASGACRGSGASRSPPSTSPGRGYETWTRAELYERAQELDIQGRAGMKKRDLIEALRNH